jgi:hypothetical protein
MDKELIEKIANTIYDGEPETDLQKSIANSIAISVMQIIKEAGYVKLAEDQRLTSENCEFDRSTEISNAYVNGYDQAQQVMLAGE